MNITKTLCLIVSILIGSQIFYKYINVGIGLKEYVFSVILLISSILAILLPTNFKFKNVNKFLSSIFIWALTMSAALSMVYTINQTRNSSPILLSAKYFWEEVIEVQFKKNGTYHVINRDMFNEKVSYGKYRLQDSMILLKDKMKFGMSYMNDTLFVSNQGVSFTMETPWRISEGTMSYVYSTETKFPIINHSSFGIDSISIKLSYTKEKTKTLLLSPDEEKEFDFKMKNPYVNGKYYLTFKIQERPNDTINIRNLLNGYPLESVKSITFKETYIKIDLLFGSTIAKNYI